MLSEQARIFATKTAYKFLSPLRATETVKYYTNKEDTITFISQFDSLITGFNSIGVDSPIAGIMPATRRLKEILKGNKLPNIDDFQNQSGTINFKRGVREARTAMVLGQKLKHGKVPSTPETIETAIGSVSLNTTPEALKAAAIGHILERTIFSHFRQQNLDHEWKKDDVLHALEEVALLKYIEDPDNPNMLFSLITTLPRDGGLGWKKPWQVQDFLNEYQNFMNNSEII